MTRSWIVAGLAALCLTPALASEAPNPDLEPYSETLDVQLLNVPFFAFDERDQPILDLRQDEVELLVDGQRVSIDSFDSSPHRAPAATTLGEVRFAAPPRHLVVLVDRAFQSPWSLRTTGQALGKLLEGAAPTDLLHLLVFDPASGLSTLVGGVPATRADQVLDRFAEIKPSNLLTLNASAGIDARSATVGSAGGRGALGAPGGQDGWVLDGMRASGLGQYRGTAESLASALDGLAGELVKLPGTKLLAMFSDGPSFDLLFSGDNGLMAGSSGLYHVRNRNQTAFLGSFDAPLAKLAEAGIVTLFVNPRGTGSVGRETLRHFGEAAGGIYAEGPDAAHLGRQLQAVTAAYYEIGTYHDKSRPVPQRESLEVRVRRPGVRAQVLAAAHELRGRRSQPELGGKDWIAALVHRGPQALPHAEKPGQLEQIPGRVAGRKADHGTDLVFEPSWAEVATTGDLEVYDVLLAVRPGDSRPELRHFERTEAGRSRLPSRFETTLPADGAAIWGIVLVDPASGRTWYRRLLLEVPKPVAK